MSTQRVREEAMLAAQYAVKGFTHPDAVQLAKFHRQFRMANGDEGACERMAREALGKSPVPQGAALGATLTQGRSVGLRPSRGRPKVSFHDLREQFVRAGYDETQADQMARAAMSN